MVDVPGYEGLQGSIQRIQAGQGRTWRVIEPYGRCTPFLHMGSLPAGPGMT